MAGDADVVIALTFPGWRRATEEWKKAGRPSGFKSFVTDSYGLSLKRFDVQLLAARTVELSGVPPEIARLSSDLVAFAG